MYCSVTNLHLRITDKWISTIYYWAVDNPHWLREVERQRPWAINVWWGIVGKKLIGPYFIDNTLNGEKYRNFLVEQLPLLLEELPLSERMTLWYQHDGCPAHHSLIAREILDRKFNGRWIGRGGPVNWPARSPDLTAPDFFLWGYLKEIVYRDVPTTRDDMINRIRNACGQIDEDLLLRVCRSFLGQIQRCIEAEGHHFEYLLK